MRHSWFFALPFASLCHLYAFGFSSVSPFWGAPNPDWLNELRSDYPLNSTCVEWSYFDRVAHRNAGCVSLPSNGSALLNRCSRSFPFLDDGRCASFYAFVHTHGPCAADSHATGSARLTFAVSCLSTKTVAQRSVAHGFVASGTALVCGVACFAEWPTIPRDVWRSCARRRGSLAEAVCRAYGQCMSL
jgi:hypothetical protein